MSPDGKEILAVFSGLTFPGDVMATIAPATQTITTTVDLETGTDTMGQLVSDGTLGYVWVTDETNGGDVTQNLNLARRGPGQPALRHVGRRDLARTQGAEPFSVDRGGLERRALLLGGGWWGWHLGDVRHAGVPTDSGHRERELAIAGDCREVPDVSADADPSSGYVVYDSVDGLSWTALGGTSGAAPLWAAVLAVVASANDNTNGYGLLNPALYQLAQQSPDKYVNDVASGTTITTRRPAATTRPCTGTTWQPGSARQWPRCWPPGSPVPLDVAVSGSQTYGESPTFTASPNFDGPGTLPSGVTLNASGLTCGQVSPSTAISGSLASGVYTLLGSSCGGATLIGPNADYRLIAHGHLWRFHRNRRLTRSAAGAGLSAHSAAGVRVLAGGVGRWHLQFRLRPVLRIDREHQVAAAGGRRRPDGEQGRLLAGGLRRRHLRLRRRRLLRLDPRGRPRSRRIGAPAQPERSDRRHGAVVRRWGLFMVASDGGVFAFGDARFAGSVPGNRWLLRGRRHGGARHVGQRVLAGHPDRQHLRLRRCPFYGAPGNQGSPVTSAVRTRNGGGYWVLLADGAVYAYGDAVGRGGPVGSVGGLNPASAIFADADGGGYWVAAADGGVFSYGDAPDDGSMLGSHLNGSIIAASGF